MKKQLPKKYYLLLAMLSFFDQSKSYPFVRVSYSLSTPEQIDTGMARFGKVLRQELNIPLDQ